ITSDTQEFIEALERGDVQRAVGIYGGPFLDGFYLTGAAEFERWVEAERAGYVRKYRGALESLAAAARQRGDANGSVECWQLLAEAEPLNSRIAISYMEALSAAGDHAGALHFARSHETLLREELDAEPDAAVVAVAERIRTHPTAVLAAAGDISLLARVPSKAPAASVAVLPFVNLGPEQENEFFSDGMTDEVTNVLSQIPGLRVAARSSAFACRGKQMDARQIGERLGVSTLLEGSVRKVGNRIRLTAQLIDAADGYHLWSQTYDRTLDDVFVLQEELARAIVRALPLPTAGARPEPVIRPPTGVLEAYTLYLRGLYFARKRTVEGFRIAIEYFEQVTEKDPNYALAYAGLAQCYALLGFDEWGVLPARSAMPRAKAAAERALELDPTLAEAHCWRAVLALIFDWDRAKAETGFLKAIELKPEHAVAHTWYALLLSVMGRHDAALERILLAERLDPESLTIHLNVGRVLCFARRYDEALERLRATLEMEPRHALTYVWLARTLLALGAPQEALTIIQQGVQVAGRNLILITWLGQAHAALGHRKKAMTIVEELRQERERHYVPLVYTLYILARLGDQEAFEWVEKVVHERSGHLAFGSTDPVWDPLRADPRFETVLRGMGPTPR
ncbi:MAG: tetratricopeptide repeat protein, partial [Gemmatimonadales bacterium]|nr:tetratricopeptide repeat protein [Gemmatimonadales bacterium]